MSDPPSVLIAERTGARATVEPLLGRAGFTIVSVGSTFEVLRAVRDHRVNLVLIDPDLAGSGVSGADVVRILKSATRFRELPVFLLLDGGRQAPADVPADGAIEVDRTPDETILAMLTAALQHGTRPTAGPVPTVPAPVPELSREEVERIVREIAREVVPVVAERLIREEIRRLREEYGLGGQTG